MEDIPDFDLEAMLSALTPLIEQHAKGTKERDAAELAQLALLYIHRNQKEEDFKEFRKSCVDTNFTVEVAHEFATREEADKWLAGGTAKDREHVKIAGKGFLTVQLPGRMTFIDRPLPEELHSDEWKDDSEDEEESDPHERAPMPYNPDFALEDMLYALNPIIESYAKGSKERAAAELAQIALLYIQQTQKEEDFRRFHKFCTDTNFTIEVEHEFATREEALQWLASGKAKDRERLKIAGKGYMAVEVTGRLRLMVAPLPEELNSDEWKDDSEDDEESGFP